VGQGGRPQERLDRRYVPPPAVGERMNHDESVAGAETKAVCAQRIHAAMDEILQSPCAHQIIVTHGGSLTFVVASWIRMPIESAGSAGFRAPSDSITTLREDDFFHNRQVVSLGDTRHLPRSGRCSGLPRAGRAPADPATPTTRNPRGSRRGSPPVPANPSDSVSALEGRGPVLAARVGHLCSA
jgi:hypothetical protein